MNNAQLHASLSVSPPSVKTSAAGKGSLDDGPSFASLLEETADKPEKAKPNDELTQDLTNDQTGDASTKTHAGLDGLSASLLFALAANDTPPTGINEQGPATDPDTLEAGTQKAGTLDAEPSDGELQTPIERLFAGKIPAQKGTKGTDLPQAATNSQGQIKTAGIKTLVGSDNAQSSGSTDKLRHAD